MSARVRFGFVACKSNKPADANVNLIFVKLKLCIIDIKLYGCIHTYIKKSGNYMPN